MKVYTLAELQRSPHMQRKFDQLIKRLGECDAKTQIVRDKINAFLSTEGSKMRKPKAK